MPPLQQTRTLGYEQTLPWTGSRTGTLLRLFVWLVFIGSLALFYTRSRVNATESALALDAARARYRALQVQHAQLEVELATLKSHSSLLGRARSAGFRELPVVEVP